MMSLITTAEKNQKRLLTGLLGYIMRKEDLQNLTLTGHITSRRDKGKQRVTLIKSLCKLKPEQGLGEVMKRQNLPQATNERNLWKTMIAHILNGCSTLKKKS